MSREKERAELYKGIGKIADDLRGSVDGWDFKQYILGFLFYRYISETIEEQVDRINNRKIDEKGFAELHSDDLPESVATNLVADIGYYVAPEWLFKRVRKAAIDDPTDLNVTLSKVFKSIENSTIGVSKAEAAFKGLFDDVDVNSTKLGGTVEERNRRLLQIMNGIASIKFGRFGENSIDAFGDAYEYLMGMYARNAGRSGGEYFTPQEVSELLTRISIGAKKTVNKVYDPTSGSGSLLLQAAKILGKDQVKQGYFGQELNYTTYNLSRINMILHGISFDKFDIRHGDTLKDFKHGGLEPFDVIVSNPPYSVKWESDTNPLLAQDERFTPAGVLAPASKADLAFTMHILNCLSDTGTAAIVSFPGVLYRTGREQQIRKYLIGHNYVDAIIQLPEDLFYGTNIATVIMVLKKNKTETKTKFINASKEFVRVTNSNKLSEENMSNILKYYEETDELAHVVATVENSEIEKEKYNLNVTTYVEPEDTREKIDIVKLNKELKDTADNISRLRLEIEDIIKEIEGDENE